MSKATIKQSVRSEVLARHNCCVCCGSWEARHCGHIVSEANGGEATPENLLRMCEACNTTLGKTDLKISTFAEYDEDNLSAKAYRLMVEANRAAFAKWCGAARSGRVKVKPFRPVA